jgi:hypothetical protein
MSDLIRLPADPARAAKAEAACNAALAQMYGYYDYAWKPFAPAVFAGVKQAA